MLWAQMSGQHSIDKGALPDVATQELPSAPLVGAVHTWLTQVEPVPVQSAVRTILM